MTVENPGNPPILVRLVTSEIVIGIPLNYYSFTNAYSTEPLQLYKMRALMITQGAANTVNVGLVPLGHPFFKATDDEYFVLQKAHVIQHGLAGPEIVQPYMREISGLIIPAGQIKVP